MVSFLIIFLNFAHFWICCHGGKVKMREVAYLYEMYPCEGITYTSFFNSSFYFLGKDDYKLNLNLILNGTYNHVQAIFDTKTCATRELGDCIDMLTFQLEDYCSFATNKGDWNLILDRFEPPLKCPMKDRYELKNFTISDVIPQIKKFLGVGLLTDGTIYYTILTLKSHTDTIVCLKIIGTFRLVRGRPPKNN